MRPCGATHAADRRGAAAAAWVRRLSLFKGALSVKAMTPVQLKRQKALADLKAKRDGLLADIAAMETKVLLFARKCSDGPNVYAAEMGVHIARAKALVAELEPLIAQLEGQPVQLDLLAV